MIGAKFGAKTALKRALEIAGRQRNADRQAALKTTVLMWWNWRRSTPSLQRRKII